MEAILEQIETEHTQTLQEVTAYYSNLKIQAEKAINSLDYFNLPETKEIPLEVYCYNNTLITTEEFESVRIDLENKVLDNILYEMSKWKGSFSGKKEVKISTYQQKEHVVLIQAKLVLHKPPINYTNLPQFIKRVRRYQSTNTINPVYLQPYEGKLNIVQIQCK